MTIKHLASLNVTGTLKATGGVITIVTDGEPTVALDDGAIAVDTTNDVVYYRSSGSWMQVTGGGGASNLADLDDVSLSTPQEGQYLQYDGTSWINATGSADVSIGFEDRTSSQISFDEGTRTFSISPTGASFPVWCNGIRHTFSSAQTTTIDAASGLYYIYFDADGDIQHSTTVFDFETQAPVAYVYWNQTDGKVYYFADERHGITMDWATHEYLHRTRGAAIASGFGAGAYVSDGNGDLDSHAKIDIANGTFFDEDLEVVITHSTTPTANTWQQHLQDGAKLPVFYKLNSHWVRTTPTSFPMKTGSTAQYNSYSGGNWAATDAGNGKHLISWIIATNNLNYPVIIVMGQDEYDNIGEAEAVGWEDVNLDGFPSIEFRPLHKVVFTTSSTYANTPKAAIEGVYDFRRVMSSQDQQPTVPITDHGNLTGLSDDDHLQYLTEARHDTHDHSTALSTAALNDLGDVDVASPTTLDVLQWDGTKWVGSQVVGPAGADGADGAPGADGADGAPGADGADGVGFTYRGAWSVATQYYTNDVVESGGQSFVAISDVIANAPYVGSAFWGLIAAKGADGADGIPGEPGTDGADGADGADGSNGTNGMPGQDGADGGGGLPYLFNTSTTLTPANGQVRFDAADFYEVTTIAISETSAYPQPYPFNYGDYMSNWTTGGFILVSGKYQKEVAIFRLDNSSYSSGFYTFIVTVLNGYLASFSNGEEITVSYTPKMSYYLNELSDVEIAFGASADYYLKYDEYSETWVASTIGSSSTSVAGIVQLSDSTTSTSTSLAATANSVRQGDRDTYVRLLMEVV